MKDPDFVETAAGAFAESIHQEGLLYMGTDRGSFWVSEDGGKNWLNRSKGLSRNYIRFISPSIHQKDKVYIQQTGLNYDDFGAYLFVSEDNGRTWRSIKGNLPNQPVNVIVEDPFRENVLYAGTYRGVYISEDNGEIWNYLGIGMPDASIGDIVIEVKTKDMIVATHGRGIYRTNLSALSNDVVEKSNFLFEIPEVNRPSFRDTHNDVEISSIEKVPITFWMEKNEEVAFQLVNSQDSLLWESDFVAREGYNQFRWDLVFQNEESELPYFVHYEKYLNRGKYKFRLITSEGVLSRELIVKKADD